MSLLLDALRRAAATRDGPEADRYTVPHRPTQESAHGRDAPGAARDEDAAVPYPAADPDALALVPTAGAEAASETSRESAPRPAPAPAAADSLLRAGAPRRPRTGLMLGLAGSAVVAAGALAGGGWLWYQQSQQQIDDALGAYRPQLARAQAAATESSAAPAADQPDAPAAARAGAQPVPLATASEAADAAAARANGQRPEPAREGAAGDPVAASAEAQGGATQSSAAAAVGEPPSAEPSERPPQADTAADSAPSPPARNDDRAGASAPVPSSATPSDRSAPPADAAPAADAPAEPGDASAPAAAGDAASTPLRQARALVQPVRGNPLADALERGYHALRAGEVTAADAAYGRALRLAPGNRDALLGAAAVHQRRGRGAAARRLYQRVLDAHPRDAYARAALTALDGSRPRQNESELKLLLRGNPAAPALHFALGNLYAAESRWSEAHQAYARAADGAPADPDFAYNLAVALDHLGQRDAARLAYGRALGLAVGARPEFDANAVRHRLYQLRQGG